jgi:hypothetical protein
MTQLPTGGHRPNGPAGSFGPPLGRTGPVTPPGWAPPPTWAPPPGWTPVWTPGPSQPGWGQPGTPPPGRTAGWGRAGQGPGWGRPAWGPRWPSARSVARPKASLLPTFLVASVIAVVVLGGIGLDAAIAGTVTVGGPVVMTAASGWVLAESNDPTSGFVELRKASAILTAQVVSSSYAGSSASLLAVERESLDAEVAQISYGDQRITSINGHDTSYVVFGATVTSGGHSGVIDGELICMIVEGNAVVIVVAAPQGDLNRVVDDVSAMIESVRVAQ